MSTFRTPLHFDPYGRAATVRLAGTPMSCVSDLTAWTRLPKSNGSFPRRIPVDMHWPRNVTGT